MISIPYLLFLLDFQVQVSTKAFSPYRWSLGRIERVERLPQGQRGSHPRYGLHESVGAPCSQPRYLSLESKNPQVTFKMSIAPHPYISTTLASPFSVLAKVVVLDRGRWDFHLVGSSTVPRILGLISSLMIRQCVDPGEERALALSQRGLIKKRLQSTLIHAIPTQLLVESPTIPHLLVELYFMLRSDGLSCLIYRSEAHLYS